MVLVALLEQTLTLKIAIECKDKYQRGRIGTHKIGLGIFPNAFLSMDFMSISTLVKAVEYHQANITTSSKLYAKKH